MVFWSFFSGFLSVPFGFWELGYWLFLKTCGRDKLYPAVSDIWCDRSGQELASYALGNIFFLSWPLIPICLHIGRCQLWMWISVALVTTFTLQTFVTMTIPVGARRRYGWLCKKQPTSFERLFIGQVPIRMLLGAREAGAWSMFAELFVCYWLFVVIAASVNFCIYKAAPETSFNIPQILGHSGMPENVRISFLDFLYYSLISVTTTGFGDIYPKFWLPQLVVMVTITLGWMYLVAMIPFVFQRLSRSGERHTSVLYRTTPRNHWITSPIQHGLKTLYESPSLEGAWETPLSGNCISTGFVLKTLRTCSTDIPVSPKVLSALKAWCVPHSGQEYAKLDRHVLMMAQEYRLDYPELFGNLEHSSMRESTDSLLKWFVGVLGNPSMDDKRRLYSISVPNPDEWLQWYGRHWSTYAVVAALLAASYQNNVPGIEANSRRLLALQNESKNWFGDYLLTSLSILALKIAGVGQTAWHAAVTWLAEHAGRYHNGIPLLANLNIWHTGLALELLSRVGMSTERLDLAVKWLGEQFHQELGGWSWSSESEMICFDSTSTALLAIDNLNPLWTDIRRMAELARNTIKHAGQEDNGGIIVFPTFYEGRNVIATCPVISARCIQVLPYNQRQKYTYAGGIAGKVVDAGWQSDWFSDPAISEGFVLAYTARIGDPTDRRIAALAKKVLADAEMGRITTLEGCGAAILGLVACHRFASQLQGLDKALRPLVERVVAESDGWWRGGEVGVFGFGLRYGCDHFATVLALNALIEFRSVFMSEE